MENTDTYRVLTAMRDLGQFTVDALVQRSGVNRHTVRTVLARRRSLVEMIGSDSTGKRGGKYKRYRIIAGEEAKTLQSEAGNLFAEQCKALVAHATTPADERAALAPSLLIAQDLIGRRYKEAATPADRRQLLELAGWDLASAREELAAAPPETDPEDMRTVRERVEHAFEVHQRLVRLEHPFLFSQAEPPAAFESSNPSRGIAQKKLGPDDGLAGMQSFLVTTLLSRPKYDLDFPARAAAAFSKRFSAPAVSATRFRYMGERITRCSLYSPPDSELLFFGSEPAFYAPGVTTVSGSGRLIVNTDRFQDYLERSPGSGLAEAVLEARSAAAHFTSHYFAAVAHV